MRIVITGALGHIGSSLIRNLQADQFTEVVLFDNLSTQRYCSLFDLPDGIPFRFIEGDVTTTSLEPLLGAADVVVHLAAMTNAAGSFDIQEQVELVNYEGTRRVAQACASTGSRLLFVSTTSVYGTQADTVDEACGKDELRPQSPYATSKLRAEDMLGDLGASEGLRFFIGRFGTIFGTSIGMRFHTAINKFCWQACVGQPLTVWRTAMDQRRPYLDLADAVRAIKFVIAQGRFDNQIYNVLTENSTVRQIVDLIRVEIPEAEVRYVDTRIMNQLSYFVSAAKFAAVGFEPRGSLAAGIRNTLRLIRRMNSARLPVVETPLRGLGE